MNSKDPKCCSDLFGHGRERFFLFLALKKRKETYINTETRDNGRQNTMPGRIKHWILHTDKAADILGCMGSKDDREQKRPANVLKVIECHLQQCNVWRANSMRGEVGKWLK